MDLLKLNAFPSVAANATCSLSTNQLSGYALHGLVFELGGTTFPESDITRIQARVNGKDLVNNMSGSQLLSLNKYEGLPDETSELFLFFGDPTARTIRGQHLGDVDFSVYDYPLEIQVDIGGATAPTLQCYALVGVPKQQMGIGYTAKEAAIIRALPRTVIQPAAAVSLQAYAVSIGSSPGARIRRVAFFNSNLTAVQLQKQSLMKWQNVSDTLNSAVQSQFARDPQSGLYVLDRVMDGNQGESESTVTPDGKSWNIQVALTTSAADTITTFADIFTTLPGL